MHGICMGYAWDMHFGSFWELTELTIFERRAMLATWPTARCRSSVMCVVPALSRPSWTPSALALKRQPNRRNMKSSRNVKGTSRNNDDCKNMATHGNIGKIIIGKLQREVFVMLFNASATV